jgi:hypothetical protein
MGSRAGMDGYGKSRITRTVLNAIRASFLVTRTTRQLGWCTRASWLSVERRIAFNFSYRCVGYVSKIGHIMWQILLSVLSCRRRKLPLWTNVFILLTETFVLPFPVPEHCAERSHHCNRFHDVSRLPYYLIGLGMYIKPNLYAQWNVTARRFLTCLRFQPPLSYLKPVWRGVWASEMFVTLT